MSAAVENTEKRLERRYEVQTSLTYCRFASSKTPSFSVTAHNCSQGGLCFQSPTPLKPGQALCVYAAPGQEEVFPSDRHKLLLKSFSLAEVRWCRKQKAAKTSDYLIGLQYL